MLHDVVSLDRVILMVGVSGKSVGRLVWMYD